MWTGLILLWTSLQDSSSPPSLDYMLKNSQGLVQTLGSHHLPLDWFTGQILPSFPRLYGTKFSRIGPNYGQSPSSPRLVYQDRSPPFFHGLVARARAQHRGKRAINARAGPAG
jgi:hypothetical protein